MKPNNEQINLDIDSDNSGATFSKCRNHRYLLWRKWNTSLPNIMFIGLNPSTANEYVNDPTIIRCIKFSKNWGFGSLYMVNLFSIRTPHPSDLEKKTDIVGKKNDYWILKTSKKVSKSIACWGNYGSLNDRDLEVKKLIRNLFYLKLNKSGQPAHPLYLKSHIEPFPYK
ncbi:MAG: DUF1643 domain-containing protein [Pelagibacteraceae bacterium TMED124]|nr:hypothetical protein [Candidatus Neomarinimicrobiota bacterium]RPG18573.1 MAG: DUF1643 domain-containing protein [Pelagibacteraceae bacterium TMED124]|tara:strand:+ start:625 stop:1131 length:507 start_codon:yes stop_codon:yes gene_type:complete